MSIKNILAPVDFSKRSRTALQYAIELARSLSARVEVLHVVPPPSLAAMAIDAALNLPMPAVDPGELERAVTELRSFVATLPQDGVEITMSVEPGHPAATIVRIASEKPHDLVIMGTRGRGALHDVLLGSVARTVVESAPCPVLTLREPGNYNRWSERASLASASRKSG
jgi:nucleotide-binding universal stress UspA family protein